MEWVLMPLRRYAEFGGRSRRREYWSFALAQAVVLIPLAFAAGLTGTDPGLTFNPLSILYYAATLALLLPNLAVAVRRLHDQERSGWYLLVAIVPLVGVLIYFVLMLLEGTRGPNRYGPDPKEAAAPAPAYLG